MLQYVFRKATFMTIKNKRLCSQNTLIWLCCFVYTLAYIGRYSYNANINLIMNEYSTSHADAGLVTTFFFFAISLLLGIGFRELFYRPEKRK